jgi:hypothetical protein
MIKTKRTLNKLPVLAAVCMVFGVLPLAAQQTQQAQQSQQQERSVEERWGAQNISDLYYVNVPIEKVYPYRKGYVVLYRKGANELARAYIPFEWFKATVRKAELIQLGDGKTWPCMSVFYKDGAFHGVRLYVSKRLSHLTWGVISSVVNIDDRFEVDSIDLSHKADEQQQQ